MHDIFNNREISLLIWLGILVIGALSKKAIRNPFINTLKLLIGKQFLFVYITLGIYLLGLLSFLKHIGFWSTSDLKDSIFWFISVAIVLTFNTDKAKNSDYFKKIIRETIKIIVVLEFIINFYSFSLMTEIILLPVLSFIIMLQEFANLSPKNAGITKLLTSIISIFGIGLLIYTFYNITNDYANFFSFETLHSFFLPILLTILFLPYLYFISLYSVYESYFVRFDFINVKKERIKEAKTYIRREAHININRLNRIIEHFDKKVLFDGTDLKKYIKKISK